MSAAKVYSYLRFSDAKQAAGGSIDRQKQYAARWAAEHGLTLDESLSMRDEGLSAFHQKHVKSGALGVFLEATTAGKIPVGSVLIVEGLDRLSRAEPILAQAQLTQIINAGLTVVTAADGKQYSRESLRETPMDMIYSLLMMIRAHEESDTKSKRVKAAVRRQCEDWISGKRRERIVNGRDPGWLRWNGQAFELIDDRAEGMRMVVKMFLAGNGFVRIAKELEKHGLAVTGANSTGWIYQLIQRPDLIGVRLLKADGEQFRLEGYYPRLITDDEFARLQVEYERRRQTPRAPGGKSKFPGIFTGINIGTCGTCGMKLISQNQTRQRADGTPMYYRRLLCSKCSPLAAANGSWGAVPIERAILDYCSDQMNLESLTTGGDNTTALRADRASIALKVAGLEQKVGKMLDAALDDAGELPQVMVRRMREIEQQIENGKARQAIVDAELRTMANVPASARAEVWKELRDGVLGLDHDARLKARKLIAETFSSVKIYFAARDTATGAPMVNIMLTAKSGENRLLSVDRKSGKLLTAITANMTTDNTAATAVTAQLLAH